MRSSAAVSIFGSTTKVPGINERLAEQVCEFMQLVRRRDFYKRPGIAETIDWATALLVLHRDALDAATIDETLGCIFKYNDDIAAFRESDIPELLAQVAAD
jgi:hypothetical protein